jgi:hypothetical protein
MHGRRDVLWWRRKLETLTRNAIHRAGDLEERMGYLDPACKGQQQIFGRILVSKEASVMLHSIHHDHEFKRVCTGIPRQYHRRK